jgi:hypothetical protein
VFAGNRSQMLRRRRIRQHRDQAPADRGKQRHGKSIAIATQVQQLALRRNYRTDCGFDAEGAAPLHEDRREARPTGGQLH